jgi:hypothetical protein
MAMRGSSDSGSGIYPVQIRWLHHHDSVSESSFVKKKSVLPSSTRGYSNTTNFKIPYLLLGADIFWKADSHSAWEAIARFLYGIRKFITVLTKALHWALSWASWIQFAPPIPNSLRSILILSSHLRLGLPSDLLSVLPTKILYKRFPSPMRATCPTHLILLDLIPLTILGETTVYEVHHYAIFSTIRLPPF